MVLVSAAPAGRVPHVRSELATLSVSMVCVSLESVSALPDSRETPANLESVLVLLSAVLITAVTATSPRASVSAPLDGVVMTACDLSMLALMTA
jgi:hypothetical protein